MITDYKEWLTLRLLVGLLGERSQHDWWGSSFFGDYSLRYLEHVAPRTSRLAQYHGVVEAARRVHDDLVNVGSYHLFRLPEEVEQDLHALMTREGGAIAAALPAPDQALAQLETLGTAAPAKGEGPIAIGRLRDWRQADMLAAVAGHYALAFSRGIRRYPYWVN